jgi:hypothetical protein
MKTSQSCRHPFSVPRSPWHPDHSGLYQKGSFPGGMRIPCSPTIVNELPRLDSHHLLSPCPAKMRGMVGCRFGGFPLGHK